MAVIESSGGTLLAVDSSFLATRASIRPLDYGALGSYRMSTTIALVATQAVNGTLFSWRWGDATRFAVLHYVRIECIQTSGSTANISPSFEMILARSFSVSDSAGTAITLSGNSMKKRTNMGTTLVTDIRKSSVAAGLTVGTRTLDANASLQIPTSQTTATNTGSYRKELDLTNSMDMPIVFAQNEGFIIRGPTVVFGATGTANLIVDVAWSEVTAY